MNFEVNTTANSTASVKFNPSNKNPAITIDLITSPGILRDIKTGGNANKVFGGILAEIPYCENGAQYTVIDS